METRTIPNQVLLPEVGRLLSEGREVVIAPKGTSMVPFIIEGRDSVALKKSSGPNPGDIVLADLGGRFVLHRVIRVEGGKLTLMGDGNIRGTESCEAEDVLGTVVGIIRGDRTRRPGAAVLWRRLLPARRYILAIYRRTAGRRWLRPQKKY